MENKNFLCFQCSDALGGKGCTKVGVCGKTADVARMQDLLIYVTKGISAVTTQLRAENKIVKPRVNHLITMNLFVTITNANFDREVLAARVEQTLKTKAKLLAEVSDKKICPPPLSGRTNKKILTHRPRRLASARRRTKTSVASANSSLTGSKGCRLTFTTQTPSASTTKKLTPSLKPRSQNFWTTASAQMI